MWILTKQNIFINKNFHHNAKNMNFQVHFMYVYIVDKL